ncbi:nucleotidyltransferase domain-containing protein [Algoriphagus halophytocola]|uniref:Nucleotidyltransferase domain-containing protein n=1 Tax=Algoriphagus halophytocola TaxID=2991499 RepID=A0ABY6MKB4_9BACT|nr:MULTISPECIES: nucleotidyltransferase domain-containing protein [unclassified Algoriphagus]UZD22721.1 nucleotidyltransferase domain-containing protein [Algoriphagus sp. TR-M5]WBL43986.1 nucleotidyltransferase domain-containing protein [Algoriphagus sp. TR-M9]
MNELTKHIDQIRELCEANKVASLFAFGSITTNKFNSDSDIDLIIDIDEKDPLNYSDYYFEVKDQLSKILKRPIDLLELKTLKNSFLKKEIEQSKVLVYGR